jgi:hypothetical protein
MRPQSGRNVARMSSTSNLPFAKKNPVSGTLIVTLCAQTPGHSREGDAISCMISTVYHTSAVPGDHDKRLSKCPAAETIPTNSAYVNASLTALSAAEPSIVFHQRSRRSRRSRPQVLGNCCVPTRSRQGGLLHHLIVVFRPVSTRFSPAHRCGQRVTVLRLRGAGTNVCGARRTARRPLLRLELRTQNSAPSKATKDVSQPWFEASAAQLCSTLLCQVVSRNVPSPFVSFDATAVQLPHPLLEAIAAPMHV